MRWLLFALTLAAMFTVFVVVAVVRSAGTQRGPAQFELHEPETDEEHAAARAAVAYLRGLARDRPADVCRVVAEPLTTTMRCATRPRIPKDMRVSQHGRLRIINIRVRGNSGDAWAGGVSPGPTQGISLLRVGRAWRVVANHAFGLA